MKICAIVQARMSSRRLPGKVLKVLNGKSILEYVLVRLKQSKNLTAIIVATSTDQSDEAVIKFCQARNIPCVQGPLDHVANRFLKVLERFPMDAFVRVSGDSPVIDPQIVDRLVSIFKSGNYDIVTNVLERSFPKGQSVEIVNSSVFKKSFSNIKGQYEEEHVTPYFYQNADRFRIFNLISPNPVYGSVHMAIDNQKDLERFDLILQRINRPIEWCGLEELVTIYNTIGAEVPCKQS